MIYEGRDCDSSSVMTVNVKNITIVPAPSTRLPLDSLSPRRETVEATSVRRINRLEASEPLTCWVASKEWIAHVPYIEIGILEV